MRGIPVTPLLWPPLSQSFLSDKNTRRDRIVLWSAPSLLVCSGRREPFPAPSSSSRINNSKHFQLVNVCSFCESHQSSAYHYNPLSPNPLTNILGLRLFYCIRENLLVLLIPAVHILLLCHMFIILTAFKWSLFYWEKEIIYYSL